MPRPATNRSGVLGLGEERDTASPRPSTPDRLVVFNPHDHNVPSALTATEKLSPASTLAQLATVPTCTGEDRLGSGLPYTSPRPIPSWPWPPCPHAHNVLSVLRERV